MGDSVEERGECRRGGQKGRCHGKDLAAAGHSRGVEEGAAVEE